MKTFSIHQTKTHLSKLLETVSMGGTIIFGDRGRPQYQISKIDQKKIDRSKAFGAWKNKMRVARDAFSKETDEKLWKDFWKEDTNDPNKRS